MAKQAASEPHATTAFLDRGSRFEGTLSFQGSVRIDGVFKGDIVTGNHLVLGAQAEVEGTINVDEVIVSGRFNGTITAAKAIVLHDTAVVEGTLTTPKLAIDAGAKFNGSIQMGGGRETAGREKKSDADAMAEQIARVSASKN